MVVGHRAAYRSQSRVNVCRRLQDGRVCLQSALTGCGGCRFQRGEIDPTLAHETGRCRGGYRKIGRRYLTDQALVASDRLEQTALTRGQRAPGKGQPGARLLDIGLVADPAFELGMHVLEGPFVSAHIVTGEVDQFPVAQDIDIGFSRLESEGVQGVGETLFGAVQE